MKLTWSTLNEKRVPQKAEPRFQRAEPRSMQNNVQGVGMNPNQESDNMFLTGFQNCCGTVTITCFFFTHFQKGLYIADILGLSHYLLSECEGHTCFFFSSEFFRSRRVVIKELQPVNHTYRVSSSPRLSVDDILYFELRRLEDLRRWNNYICMWRGCEILLQ